MVLGRSAPGLINMLLHDADRTYSARGGVTAGAASARGAPVARLPRAAQPASPARIDARDHRLLLPVRAVAVTFQRLRVHAGSALRTRSTAHATHRLGVDRRHARAGVLRRPGHCTDAPLEPLATACAGALPR